MPSAGSLRNYLKQWNILYLTRVFNHQTWSLTNVCEHVFETLMLTVCLPVHSPAWWAGPCSRTLLTKMVSIGSRGERLRPAVTRGGSRVRHELTLNVRWGSQRGVRGRENTDLLCCCSHSLQPVSKTRVIDLMEWTTWGRFWAHTAKTQLGIVKSITM